MLCDKNARKMNEVPKLQDSSSHDTSVYIHSEHNIDMTAQHLQNEDFTNSSLIAVTENTASAAPNASQYTNEQYNSRATEMTDADGNCENVIVLNTNSADVDNRKSGEGHLTQFSSDASISEADVGDCHELGNVSVTCSSTGPVLAELRVSESLSRTVTQSPVQLQPKPTFTLMPVTIEVPMLLVLNTSGSVSNLHRVRLPAIAPRPADTVTGITCIPTVSQEDSSVVANCDNLPCDLSLPRMPQKAVASVTVLHTSSHSRCKTASTQTSVPRLSKESRASQVIIILVIVFLVVFFQKNRNRNLPYDKTSFVLKSILFHNIFAVTRASIVGLINSFWQTYLEKSRQLKDGIFTRLS